MVQTALSLRALRPAPVPTTKGNYVRFADEWEAELSEVTGLRVAVSQYNSSANDTVRQYCDDFSIMLFERDPEQGGFKRPRAARSRS